MMALWHSTTGQPAATGGAQYLMRPLVREGAEGAGGSFMSHLVHWPLIGLPAFGGGEDIIILVAAACAHSDVDAARTHAGRAGRTLLLRIMVEGD